MASRPLSRNLRRIHALIGKKAAGKMLSGHSFVIDGVEFVTGYVPDSTANRFYIVKSEEMLDIYREFFDGYQPRRIFELGIAEGGSTAMLALRPGIERLVAIDNEPNRLPALDEFVEQRDLGGVVRTYYGVDQADREALAAIVDRDFADGAPDLVIDDASHEYALTKTSFEVLFPRVRAGGWYLVEDWAQRLKFAEGVLRGLGGQSEPDKESPDSQSSEEAETADGVEPLERLPLEFTVAMGAWPGAIDRVSINDLFVAARRGPAPLDPNTFRLDDLIQAEPHVGLLTRRVGSSK